VLARESGRIPPRALLFKPAKHCFGSDFAFVFLSGVCRSSLFIDCVSFRSATLSEDLVKLLRPHMHRPQKGYSHLTSCHVHFEESGWGQLGGVSATATWYQDRRAADRHPVYPTQQTRPIYK
jgi:hypothetical protein